MRALGPVCACVSVCWYNISLFLLLYFGSYFLTNHPAFPGKLKLVFHLNFLMLIVSHCAHLCCFLSLQLLWICSVPNWSQLPVQSVLPWVKFFCSSCYMFIRNNQIFLMTTISWNVATWIGCFVFGVVQYNPIGVFFGDEKRERGVLKAM